MYSADVPNATTKGVIINGLIFQLSPQSGFGLSTPNTKKEININPRTAPNNILKRREFRLTCLKKLVNVCIIQTIFKFIIKSTLQCKVTLNILTI